MTKAEKLRWAEYEATYRECLRIAESVWVDRLTVATLEQQKLAESMRDRVAVVIPGTGDVGDTTVDAELHVPLFTPRDRLQFLKEATAALSAGAERRNMWVTVEQEPALPFGKSKGTPLSQLDDRTLIEARDWAVDHAAAKYADFILAATGELNKRTERATTQSLEARPLALAGEDRSNPFASQDDGA